MNGGLHKVKWLHSGKMEERNGVPNGTETVNETVGKVFWVPTVHSCKRTHTITMFIPDWDDVDVHIQFLTMANVHVPVYIVRVSLWCVVHVTVS